MLHPYFRSLPTALIALGCCAGTASASDSDSATPSALAPLIVTATRTPVPAADVLADYLYIGPEEIAQAGQMSLPELLQQKHGIQIATYGGSGNFSSVYLRGTNSNHTLVLVDGVRVESSSVGLPIWNAIPLALIDHVEVIYGPQSTYYGSDALGGVIQIFTRKGGGPVSYGASAGYGSYGTSMSDASLSGSVPGVNPTAYAFGVSQENSSGFNSVAPNNFSAPGNPANGGYPYPTTATGYKRLGATGQLSQEWAAGQTLGFTLFANRDVYQFPGNTGSLVSNPEADNSINNLVNFAFYSKNQVTDRWQSELRTSVSANNAQTLTSISNDQFATPEYDYTWQNNIALGQDMLQLLAEHRVQYLNGTNSNYFTGCSGAACIENVNRSLDSAAASYQFKHDNQLVNLALRNDNITGYGSKVTGSVAYGYFLTPVWRASLNYGTGFSAPTFSELYSPGYGVSTLAPESNKNLEAGINYETRLLNLHLVAYQNDIHNLIQTVYCTTACPQYYFGDYPANIGLARIRGTSLSADARVESFIFKGGVDLLDAVDRSTGLQLPNRAREVANVGVEYRQSLVDVGGNLTLSGQRYGYESSTGYADPMGGYALLDLYASYEFEPRWSLFTRWNNVLGVPYQLNYGYNTPGSNLFVGVRYAMK